ncbi:MAG: CFI-box-CTERM domain-containing protein [Marinilabiliaceae bacterium]
MSSIESEIKRAIDSGSDIEIRYEKQNGETSQRRVSGISYNNEFGAYGYTDAHVRGYCHLRGEDRTFRISRILAVRVLPSGLWVSNHSTPFNHCGASPVSRPATVRPTPSYSSSPSPSSSPSYSSSSSSGTSGSSGGGCYIATMAYGSYDHPQVMALRWYRDNVLQNSMLGRAFVKAYYFFSPKLVVLLKVHEGVNCVIRKVLDRLVRRIEKRKSSGF